MGRAAHPHTIERLSPKDEIDRTDETESGPEVVERQRLAHIQDRERREDRKRYRLLQDLKLRKRQRRVADPVRRDLEKIFEQGNSPAQYRGEVPGVRIPVSQV